MPITDIDISQIEDDEMRHLVGSLLNMIEDLSANVSRLQVENQRLRDENNHLKGEQGKPNIKAKKNGTNHGSEKERQQSKRHQKTSKRDKLQINREETLKIDRDSLPRDAIFKGYEEVVVQDIRVETNNVLFRKEKFYAPSTSKTYLAPLPRGYQGEFGPTIRSQVLVLYYACQMTEPKIRDWLCQIGILISVGQISNMLIKGHERFHQEASVSYRASLEACRWQHIDETTTPVNGDNQYCHVVDSPLATHYRTLVSKSRLSIIKVLLNQTSLKFRLNEEAFAFLEQLKIPRKSILSIQSMPRETDFEEGFIQQWMDCHLANLNHTQQQNVLSALAIAAYHAQTDFPIVDLLICDDASQFKLITSELALCWVHEGRHFKKLEPTVSHHRQLRDKFLRMFWGFYHRLNAYRQAPDAHKALRLDHQFERLFTIHTGYDALDKLIARTYHRKTQLLVVLHHPEIPLHNNPAELTVRQRVRKRKISFGPRVSDGVLAWDTFMSLLATTRKLGIHFQQYLMDRISGFKQIPSLSDLIQRQASLLDLDSSWHTT